MKRIWMLFLALLLLCGCAGEPPEVIPEYVLTYAENQPAGYPTVLGAQLFADLVQERTGGKVVIQIKCSGAYGSEDEVLDQMLFGGIDFARVSLAELSDELPMMNALQLPFLYEDAAHMWRILDGTIGESFLEQVSQLDLVGLSWYDGGARCFYTDQQPIRTPEDLAGLTVRVQDSKMAADMVELLGGSRLFWITRKSSPPSNCKRLMQRKIIYRPMKPEITGRSQNISPMMNTPGFRRFSLLPAGFGRNCPRSTGRLLPNAPGNRPCTSGSCGSSSRIRPAPDCWLPDIGKLF